MGRRFFRYGELPLVLLALLDRRVMGGYELMRELRLRFGPEYRASPGSVYPALEALDAEGLVEARDDAGATVYELTQQGRQALRERSSELREVELRTGVRFDAEETVDGVLERFATRVRRVGSQVDPATIEAELDEAARRIEAAADGQDREGMR